MLKRSPKNKLVIRLFSHYFRVPFVSSAFPSFHERASSFILSFMAFWPFYCQHSLALSLSHQFHIFSAPSFSFPLRFSFFLCEVAVGGMAGRQGSPEGILGAEVPVIHYPACFSLWQACDRVLLRALTHTRARTHSCI